MEKHGMCLFKTVGGYCDALCTCSLTFWRAAEWLGREEMSGYVSELGAWNYIREDCSFHQFTCNNATCAEPLFLLN